jgi:hypothetical protein
MEILFTNGFPRVSFEGYMSEGKRPKQRHLDHVPCRHTRNLIPIEVKRLLATENDFFESSDSAMTQDQRDEVETGEDSVLPGDVAMIGQRIHCRACYG